MLVPHLCLLSLITCPIVSCPPSSVFKFVFVLCSGEEVEAAPPRAPPGSGEEVEAARPRAPPGSGEEVEAARPRAPPGSSEEVEAARPRAPPGSGEVQKTRRAPAVALKGRRRPAEALKARQCRYVSPMYFVMPLDTRPAPDLIVSVFLRIHVLWILYLCSSPASELTLE
ncbi:hypothetical protein CRENBAI_013895 [Crenichthys baileyi]|uniref:Uncharacterized protein n=1 Tax=Crenichthys baileyi TaxID=28760 RepID=A0AAV9SEP9_9TELE